MPDNLGVKAGDQIQIELLPHGEMKLQAVQRKGSTAVLFKFVWVLLRLHRHSPKAMAFVPEGFLHASEVMLEREAVRLVWAQRQREELL